MRSADFIQADVIQPKTNTKSHTSAYSKQTPKKTKNAKSLLKEPELNLQQFKIASNDLPVGLALHKVIYNEKGVAVDFVPLEVNHVYEEILGFKKEQILWKKAGQYFLEIKKEAVDWIEILGRVAATRVPEYFQIYCSTKEKYFQVYVYSPKKGYCISLLMDITRQGNNGANRLERKKAEQKLANAEKRSAKVTEKLESLNKKAIAQKSK